MQKQWRDAKPIVELPDALIETTEADLPGWMLSLMPERERGYIRKLQIRAGEFSDKNYLEAIAKLPQIRELELILCNLDDKDCELLARAKSLEKVQLSVNRDITDKGVEALLRLPNLENMTVVQTKATWKSHARVQQLGLPNDVLLSDYRGLVEITERNPDVDAINMLPDPPFRGVAVEAGKADLELLRKLKSMRQIQLYISNDALPGEMEVLEEVLKWPQLTSIKIMPGKQGVRSSKRGCSDVLFNEVAKLLESQSKAAEFYVGSGCRVTFDLEPIPGNAQQRKLEFGLFSVMDDFIESIEPMRKIESLEFNGYSENMAQLLRVFPCVRSLQMEPYYPGLDKDSKKYFANLENLEDLKIKAHGSYQSLPWDFFSDWKSQGSLKKLHLESQKMWDRPSLKPLLKFDNLESVFVFIGRGEPLQSFDEINVAIETEKPPPKVAEEGRFRWFMSKMAADVEQHFTPPRSRQKANRRR